MDGDAVELEPRDWINPLGYMTSDADATFRMDGDDALQWFREHLPSAILSREEAERAARNRQNVRRRRSGV